MHLKLSPLEKDTASAAQITQHWW